MSKIVSVQFTGVKELEELIGEMQDDFGIKDQKKILTAAVRKSMAPVLSNARQLAPVDTGALRASLRIEARKPSRKDKKSIYVNPNDVFPIGDIYVGFTRWHLDYSVISFYPIPNGDGTTTWQRQYFYQVINHNSIYDLGYIKFQVNGSVRIFKILSDGMESITLRTTGSWPYANVGPNQLVTLQLTRIGP